MNSEYQTPHPDPHPWYNYNVDFPQSQTSTNCGLLIVSEMLKNCSILKKSNYFRPDDCKTMKEARWCITKQGPNTKLPDSLNNESTTTEPHRLPIDSSLSRRNIVNYVHCIKVHWCVICIFYSYRRNKNIYITIKEQQCKTKVGSCKIQKAQNIKKAY